jgi:alpha-ketoglutaric semialdehyde dehydrogenase
MAFTDTPLHQLNDVMKQAQVAFLSYKNLSGKKKAVFLRAIADEIEALGNELITTVMRETHLPEDRVVAERARTTGHCRMFADLVEEGSWVEARIDTAQPERTPVPKPDLRKMLIPIGPVVVFGAANFPLAYSTAGGDTVSALAAGCTVVVKAHPAHSETSTLVAGAIRQAMARTGMPSGTFQHVYGASNQVGEALVTHPLTRAVGFTGSLAGGKALFDLACRRPEPIPVFAEMSSINPVILLPETLKRNAEAIAARLAASITLGVGQFCTNPGLIIAMEDEGLSAFIQALAFAIRDTVPGIMLHRGISDNYYQKLNRILEQKGVRIEAQSEHEAPPGAGRPLIASVAADVFLSHPALAEEVFGPFSLIVRCPYPELFNRVITHLHGQLTATIHGDEEEVQQHTGLLNLLKEKAGRIILNGVPTGVEVCPAMMHGGPYPATTDSRFTAVGTDAIRRFARPVAFQNFPDSLLPDELKESNPLNIWRLRNNEWGKK